jgi:hypothetical protein
MALTMAMSGCDGSNAAHENGDDTNRGTTRPDAVQPDQRVEYVDFCDTGDCPPGGVPASVRRPLRLPQVSPGTSCPVTAAEKLRIPGWLTGIVLGEGPVYPMLLSEFGARRSILTFYPPAEGGRFSGSMWGGGAVKWLSRRSYRGPILVRGRRLDGTGELRFSRDEADALPEMQLAPGNPANAYRGWRQWPAFTRIPEPGCYGWQIDGTDFSVILVFEAQPVS